MAVNIRGNSWQLIITPLMASSSQSHPQHFVQLDIIPDEDPLSPLLLYPEENETHSWCKRKLKSSPFKGWSRYIVALWRCSHVWCNARPWSKRALFCRLVQRPFWGLVFIFGLLKLLSLTWQGLVFLFPDDLDSRLDAWVFPGGRPSSFSHWTTHGVIPVACHSHNDYWRRVPLHSALAAGCVSVEADIWLSGDELLVGHTPHTLTHGQNLRSLYLDPLLDMLQKHNTRSIGLSSDKNNNEDDIAGVFANDPNQTLVLLVDFKGDGERLWSHLVEQLNPLRDAGYLTRFNGSGIIRRPITIVATGDAPFHCILESSSPREIFFDAPLDRLSAITKLASNEIEESQYSSNNTFYASVDFRNAIGSLSSNQFTQSQLTKIRSQIQAAHERGLKVWYWATPSWPRGLRNHIWHVLVREGVDVINVDDLRDATQRDWRKHRSWWM